MPPASAGPGSKGRNFRAPWPVRYRSLSIFTTQFPRGVGIPPVRFRRLSDTASRRRLSAVAFTPETTLIVSGAAAFSVAQLWRGARSRRKGLM